MKHDSDILDFAVMLQEAFQPLVGRVEGQVAHEDVVVFDPSIKFAQILKIQTNNLSHDLNFLKQQRRNKVLETKSYFQRFKILPKMSVCFDIDRACD